MSTRNSGKVVLLTLTAAAFIGCGTAGRVGAADLEIPPPVAHHAATAPARQASHPVLVDRVEVSGAVVNKTASVTDAAVTESAHAARARFLDLRMAMERGMSAHRMLGTDEVAALADGMKQLSAHLAVLVQSGHLRSSAKAMDLARDWYQTSLQVISPPAGGVTELPLPTSLADKADLVANALDEVVDEATSYAATAQRPVGSWKKRTTGAAKPVTSSTGLFAIFAGR